MNREELDEIAQRLKPFMKKVFEEKDLDMVFFMLTSILDESTVMLCYGNSVSEVMENAFGVSVKDNEVELPDIVSRKKQVVPGLIAALNRDQEI
jgi:manganese-dependent inorganic pyrophosphatase